MAGDKIMSFDRKEQIGHSYDCPVKRRRQALRSDPPEAATDIPPGEAPIGFPASHTRISRVASYASKNLGGLGAEPPVSFAYLRMGKFHFTLNQDS